MGPSALRMGDGISDALGEERFQLSGVCDRGGCSGCRTGLGGEDMIGEVGAEGGYERETHALSRSRRIWGGLGSTRNLLSGRMRYEMVAARGVEVIIVVRCCAEVLESMSLPGRYPGRCWRYEVVDAPRSGLGVRYGCARRGAYDFIPWPGQGHAPGACSRVCESHQKLALCPTRWPRVRAQGTIVRRLCH